MFHSACGSHARPCLPSDVSFLRGGVSGLFDILALSETSPGFAHGGRPANVRWMNLVEFFTPSALSGKGYSHWAGSAGMFSDSQAGNGHQEASSSISALRQTQQRPARQMQLLPLGTAPEHPRSGNPPDDASSSLCVGPLRLQPALWLLVCIMMGLAEIACSPQRLFKATASEIESTAGWQS